MVVVVVGGRRRVHMSDIENAELAVGRMDASGWNFRMGWVRVNGRPI